MFRSTYPSQSKLGWPDLHHDNEHPSLDAPTLVREPEELLLHHFLFSPTGKTYRTVEHCSAHPLGSYGATLVYRPSLSTCIAGLSFLWMTKKLWMLLPYNSNRWPNQNNLMRAKIQIGMNWSIASLTSVYTDRLPYYLAVPHLWLLDIFALGRQQSPLLLSRMNRFVKKTPGHEQLFKYTISPPSAPSILFLCISPIYCCSWRIQCPNFSEWSHPLATATCPWTNIDNYGIEHLELCGALLMARMFFTMY